MHLHLTEGNERSGTNYFIEVSFQFLLRPQNKTVPFQFDPLRIIVMHITIQPQGEWFWPVHLFLIGYPFWNFRIILEKILANNYLCETVSELDTSVIRILKCCLTCHFTWKKCLTWYLKSTYMELIESMARNWSRVKQKLYTDISPYPRRCAWNRKNCILMISYKN